jgi:hypothetical protein
VGNGNDIAATVPSRILEAVGSFDQAVGGVGRTVDVDGGIYSLQLNSNFYRSPPACSGSKNPSSCLGWQQFIFDFDDYYPLAYMQYWLIHYQNPCPSNWQAFGDSCFTNSDAIHVSVPIGYSLTDLVLLGSTGGGQDTVAMSVRGHEYVASGQDSFLDLGPNWQAAEFNIFGYCCGGQVKFTYPMYIVVRTKVYDGTSNAPKCFTNAGTTGETNDLTILGPCCPHRGAFPAITFEETSFSGQIPQICRPIVAVQAAAQYVFRRFEHP